MFDFCRGLAQEALPAPHDCKLHISKKMLAQSSPSHGPVTQVSHALAGGVHVERPPLEKLGLVAGPGSVLCVRHSPLVEFHSFPGTFEPFVLVRNVGALNR